jgi:hypothetical protein
MAGSSQCIAHPCSKVVGAQSLGHPACEAKRVAQSQGCRRSKTYRHSAPDVDRWHRIQVVIKGGYQSACMAGQPKSRRPAGPDVPAGTLASVRSPLALPCSIEQNALHTLIHQRHLTRLCGGHVPAAARTLDPAGMFTKSLTPGSELENNRTPADQRDGPIGAARLRSDLRQLCCRSALDPPGEREA